jgi:hypothetical protein
LNEKTVRIDIHLPKLIRSFNKDLLSQALALADLRFPLETQDPKLLVESTGFLVVDYEPVFRPQDRWELLISIWEAISGC